MKKKISVKWLIILSMVLILTGCNKDLSEGQAQNAKKENLSGVSANDLKVDSDEQTEDADSVSHADGLVSEQSDSKIQKIKIDTLGYEPDDEKYVFFEDVNPGDEFRVVKKDSRETILTGEIDEEKIADFSEVSSLGNYYIEVPYVGRSYQFSVDKDRYKDQYNRMKNKMLAYANEDGHIDQSAKVFYWLMQDLYVFEDKDSLEALTPGSLKRYTAIADSIMPQMEQVKEQPSKNSETLSSYCAALSILANLLEKAGESDVQYIKEAEEVYRLLESAESADEEYVFFAAVSLYSSTGDTKYKTYVEEYLTEHASQNVFSANINAKLFAKDEAYIFGVILYLKTERAVDLSLCDELVQNLLNLAEHYAADAVTNRYLNVSSDYRSRQLTDRLFVIAVVEHIIVSKEYNSLLKHAIHYFGGCNETGESYYTEYGIFDEKYDSSKDDTQCGGAFILILNEIIEK